MAKTRSVTWKLKNCSTSDSDGSLDSDGSTSWANLNHDLLFLIMRYMGVFYFIAVSRVCKSWREVALNRWNKFMVSKQPMRLSISTRLDEEACYLEDDKKRKLKTTIPHFKGGVCVGVTCGYLIVLGKKPHGFLLVNPFTGKELHFPGFPFAGTVFLNNLRGILVFSPSMFGWVFVVYKRVSCEIFFSLAGEHAAWRNIPISSGSYNYDLHFFKGKIYMIDNHYHLSELRLNPEPTLILQRMEEFPRWDYSCPEFVSSGENLYVGVRGGKYIKVDFDEMKWVDSERTKGEYAVFANYFILGMGKDKRPTASMRYFPHECLIDNDPGARLNILEEDEEKKKHDENLY